MKHAGPQVEWMVASSCMASELRRGSGGGAVIKSASDSYGIAFSTRTTISRPLSAGPL
jgi:hypothetical protein